MYERCKAAALVLVMCTIAATAADAQTFSLHGVISARGVNASGPEPALAGGLGRLATGGDRNDFFADAIIGAEWQPTTWLTVHASGLARREPSDFGGSNAGLVDAYADLHHSFGANDVRLRTGMFFLPTSRENREALWTSPYTVSLSAVNSWIAEEFRPIGAEAEWRRLTPAGFVTVAGGAFRGNDTSGTLLAWRGWSINQNRLSVYNETVPIDWWTWATGWKVFPNQRTQGTRPLEGDLDGKTGYTARVRWSLPERATVQWAYVDNQGDRELYHGEYAWRTKFHLLGATIGDEAKTSASAEYTTGSTGMGWDPKRVQADFYAGYLLVSHVYARERFSARYDVFEVADKDATPHDPNSELGRSWTLTWMHNFTQNIRGAAEFTQVTGHKNVDYWLNGAWHPERETIDGRSVTIEARYSF